MEIRTAVTFNYWLALLVSIVFAANAHANATKTKTKTPIAAIKLTEQNIQLFLKTIPEMNRLEDKFGDEFIENEALNLAFLKSGNSQALIAKMKSSPNFAAAEKEVKKLGYKNMDEFLQLSRRVGLALGRLEYEGANPGQNIENMIQQQMQQLEVLKKNNPQMAAMMEKMAGTVIAMAEGMKSISAEELSLVKKHQKQLKKHFEEQGKSFLTQ